MMNLQQQGQKILRILELALVANVPEPMSMQLIQEYGVEPFRILIACLLSLRSRDSVTYRVCKELFKIVHTPQDILAVPTEKLEQIIHKIGFFRRKAEILKSVSRQLIDTYAGIVPDNEHDLLRIKGVGRKTANLVLALAFDKPAICVDVHVHKLSNELGLVSTKKPEQTEYALQKIFPPEQWRQINRLLVMLGQNRCNAATASAARPGGFTTRVASAGRVECHPIHGLPIPIGVRY